MSSSKARSTSDRFEWWLVFLGLMLESFPVSQLLLQGIQISRSNDLGLEGLLFWSIGDALMDGPPMPRKLIRVFV